MVYVLNPNGEPLMPTKRFGKVRRMLKNKQAKVVRRRPFTIQLTYETTNYVQPVALGVDAGYQTVGFSAVSEKEELLSGECRLLTGMSERLKERAMYRRQRRSRLRYRAPRFDNRRRTQGWLAPSIQHKLDSHVRLVELVKKLLPVQKVIVEVASFDIQAIQNPEIAGTLYQEGEQLDFWNLREYILHRDHHQCQNPNCKNKAVNPILQVHHVGYWKGDRSDRPGNLVTLCEMCHIPANHQLNGFLYGWEPKTQSFRPETFMSIVRWRLTQLLGGAATYGYVTKHVRIQHGIEKSHTNDAFVIAGGTTQSRTAPFVLQQVRRNNRSLEKFYGAKHVDIRTGAKASGQDLFCGRRTRNREMAGENLRQYRGLKLCKGRRSIRRMRYPLQPMDTVRFDGKDYLVSGTNNKGKTVVLKGCVRVPSVKKVRVVKYGKGFCWLAGEDRRVSSPI
ncbi:RNA-guided endonuclease IscB [Aneurinibacillus tyrosinisolvens]|uniref:RNA-guided endonuclease IscB n=1 Tax=Aneurinibacillus tyrosinisolvens TaxID=1443435 RepID=UPI00063EDFD2|nr:RNA-guided endonuclease IscB [Aneurinibacillus tyrosinisolvens]